MKNSKKIILAIFIFAFLLRLSFALYTPNWQSSDEYPHFFVIKYLDTYGSYPISTSDFPYYEAYQPPLYYYLTKLIYSFFKEYDYPSPALNENFDPDTLTHPTNIALITLRLFSVFLSILTLFFIYKISKIFFKDAYATYTLLIAATLPTFVVNSSSVTNDALANLLGALIIFLIVKKIDYPIRGVYSYSILLGLILGLALITKANLYPFIIIILGSLFLYPITLRNITRSLIIILTVGFLVSFWYFSNNLLSYGKILPISPDGDKHYFIQSVTVTNVFQVIRNFFWSFWVAAGRIYQVHLEPIYYISIFFPITLIAIIGNVKYIFTPKLFFEYRIYIFYLFVFIVFIFIFASFYYSLFYSNNPSWGRFVYPALGPILVLFVFGLTRIFNEKYAKYLFMTLAIIQTGICMMLLNELSSL
ncbi:MAG: hypothetical protein IGBAC_1044 [Ignavibacteriae bacterium]|nr:MAG: hypothetical protein IGBAC_1044 [Ignavibacteriota bacterium]